jgi:hypothetical protein
VLPAPARRSHSRATTIGIHLAAVGIRLRAGEPTERGGRRTLARPSSLARPRAPTSRRRAHRRGKSRSAPGRARLTLAPILRELVHKLIEARSSTASACSSGRPLAGEEPPDLPSTGRAPTGRVGSTTVVDSASTTRSRGARERENGDGGTEGGRRVMRKKSKN